MEKFSEELINLMEKYSHEFSAQEICGELIENACIAAFKGAPDFITATRSIIGWIDNAIEQYQEHLNHNQE